MSFYPSKSLRLAVAALVVFALTTLTLALPRVADAAPKCKGTAQVWKVDGRLVCLKTARPKKGHATLETPGRIAFWFAEASKLSKGSRKKLPKKLLAASPKAAAAAVKVVAKASSLRRKARLAPGSTQAFAAAAPLGPVVDRMTIEGQSVTLPDGVTITSHGEARAYADGTVKTEAAVDMTVGDFTLRYQPHITEGSVVIPDVDCPTAAGLLTIDFTSSVGGTFMGLKGKTVLAAITEKTTNTIHARGHVGRDARFHDVDVTAISKIEHYERGSQTVMTMSGNYNVSRDGEPEAEGPISADLKLRVAGATAAQERAAEQQYVAEIATSAGAISQLGAQAELARWEMKRDEPKWYSLPARCAGIEFTPGSHVQLAPGKSLAVSGSVYSNAGGEASGDVVVNAVSRGSFTVTKAQSDPGSPARFNATAETPDADKTSVGADVIATSTAGRAQWGWYADYDVDLPKKLSGTISSSSSTPGTKDYFHSWVVYTLDNVYVSDSGYISAWYKLTTADQDEVTQEIGSGCRWVGKGSGGNIEDGDIELRKPPGGSWEHAVMYDVEVPDTTFVPTDCGPSPPPAFQGTLVGFVNMAMLGGGFEPVDGNFHMGGLRVYEDPASQRKTVASWDFDPGDPQ
jgi:hypothetical protein